MRAVVVTPTVGEPELAPALRSVAAQTYPARHLIVVDGPQYATSVRALVEDSGINTPANLMVLPTSTGAKGYFGHRAIASGVATVEEDVIFLLDADNTFKVDHVETCMTALTSSGADWCYALRDIIDPSGETLLSDDGESLGFWPRAMYYGAQRGFYSQAEQQFVTAFPFLVDTNCFCVRRPTFQRLGAAWEHGYGADSLFTKALMEQAKGVGTGSATVQYRLRPAETEQRRRHFRRCNELIEKLYNGRRPWRQRGPCGYVVRPTAVPRQMPANLAGITV